MACRGRNSFNRNRVYTATGGTLGTGPPAYGVLSRRIGLSQIILSNGTCKLPGPTYMSLRFAAAMCPHPDYLGVIVFHPCHLEGSG